MELQILFRFAAILHESLYASGGADLTIFVSQSNHFLHGSQIQLQTNEKAAILWLQELVSKQIRDPIQTNKTQRGIS